MKKYLLCLFFFLTQTYPWQYAPKRHLLALNTNADFGKKHFIVGYTSCRKISPITKQKNDSCAQKLLDAKGNIKTALFSPNDDLRTTLLHLIQQEQKHIAIAMFAFTDKDFADALAKAKQRGVNVEIIVDASNMYGKYNKLNALHDGSVQIFVYNPNRFNKKIPGAMHNKFVIFEKNIQNKSLVWTGSFNFTRAAHQRNQENVVVLDDNAVIEKFAEQFKELKKYTDVYQAPKSVTEVIAIR